MASFSACRASSISERYSNEFLFNVLASPFWRLARPQPSKRPAPQHQVSQWFHTRRVRRIEVPCQAIKSPRRSTRNGLSELPISSHSSSDGRSDIGRLPSWFAVSRSCFSAFWRRRSGFTCATCRRIRRSRSCCAATKATFTHDSAREKIFTAGLQPYLRSGNLQGVPRLKYIRCRHTLAPDATVAPVHPQPKPLDDPSSRNNGAGAYRACRERSVALPTVSRLGKRFSPNTTICWSPTRKCRGWRGWPRRTGTTRKAFAIMSCSCFSITPALAQVVGPLPVDRRPACGWGGDDRDRHRASGFVPPACRKRLAW